MKNKLFILVVLLAMLGTTARGLNVNVYSSNVNCFGDATGSVTASVSNGTGPYKYVWSNGTTVKSTSSTYTLTNLKAGIYSINVTDEGSGLTAFGMASVTQPEAIESSLKATDVTCKGASTGSIQLSVTGGTGNFSYLWSNSGTTQNVNHLAAGKYIVTIREQSTPSCYIQDSIEIKEPAYAMTYSYSKQDVSCYNGSNAAIDLSVYGGTPPYRYEWNSGAYATEDISSLTASKYIFEVYDANNCLVTDSVEITQPAQLTNSLSGTDARCYGFNDGSITQTVTGGTPPYKYEWWNSNYKLSIDSKDLTNVVADKYMVEVSDANNCSSMDSIVVTSPTQLKSLLTGNNVSAFGGSDGSISLSVSGGVKPYSYIWSNGASTQNQTNVKAGKYLVDIIDYNGCSISDSIELTEPSTPLSIQKYAQNVSCFGGNNGWAEIYVNGGKTPYQYIWSSGDTIPKIYNLSAGTYGVQVIDQNGISVTDSITIEQPTAIQASGSTTDNKCYGELKGEIELSVSGGQKPYTYEWRNSEFMLSDKTKDIQNLAADQYSVTIFDSNDCEATYTFTIHQPTQITIATSTVDAPCFGGPTGQVKISVAGGTQPYSYSWSNGSFTKDLEQATPGWHTVTVTDDQGCLATASDSVGKMDSITLEIVTYDATCSDRKDGQAYVKSVKGGNGSYSYLWHNGDTLANTSGLDEGSYTLIVSDFLGCQAEKEFSIGEVNTECINIPNAFTPNNDGVNDTWRLRNIDFYPECIVKVFNRWGNLVFESERGYPTEWDGTFNGQALPAGTYYYIFSSEKKLEPKNGMITIVR